MLSAGLCVALDTLLAGPPLHVLWTLLPPLGLLALLLSAQQALPQYMYTAHLSTVHLDDSEVELSPTHSTQVPRAQLIEEELSLTPSHGAETQLENSS